MEHLTPARIAQSARDVFPEVTRTFVDTLTRRIEEHEKESCLAFLAWVHHQIIAGRTSEKLWIDYQEERAAKIKELTEPLIQDLIEALFHQEDEKEAWIIKDDFLYKYPELLQAHPRTWYFENL